jgi:hypothetical protein
MKKIVKQTITGKGLYASDSIRSAATFNSGTTGIISRESFFNNPPEPQTEIYFTTQIVEYIPDWYDKIFKAVKDFFHPITKYRLRIVNTDYCGWD